MNLDYEIRPVTATEIPALSQVASTSYRETYTGIDPPDDLDYYIETTFNLATLTAQINSKEIIFYILWTGDQPIGYFKLWLWKTRDILDPKESIELEKIYLLKAYHRKGLGSILMQKIIEVAKSYQPKWLWLCVYAKNDKAITFYKKMGLEIFGTTRFITGNSSKPNYMMRIAVDG